MSIQSVSSSGWENTYNTAVQNFEKINGHQFKDARDLVHFRDPEVRQRRRGERKELVHKVRHKLDQAAEWREKHLPLPWDKYNTADKKQQAGDFLEHKIDEAITVGRIGYAMINPNPLSIKGAVEEATFQLPDVAQERLKRGWFDFPPA